MPHGGGSPLRLGPLDHDHGEVVRELAVVGPLPAGDEGVLGDLLRRQQPVLGDQLVQPLDPELLAAAARFDDAVRVRDDDRARREGARSPSRTPAARRSRARDRAPRFPRPCRPEGRDAVAGCPPLAHATSPFTESITSSTMVMKRPDAISDETTSFAAARNSPGTTCSRASERKTYFAIAMSAVASTPWPVTSPSTTASRPSPRVR